MSIITLTTDFGTGSPYVAAMKGVVLGINPAVRLVDVCHEIEPQNIRQVAIVLAEATPWFPAGAIHVGVVDPGVGTQRRLIYANIGDQHYLAPDNGLLSLLAKRARPAKIVELSNSEHWLPEVSHTFHGRDILAPVAAQLSLGLEIDRLGTALREIQMLDWPEPLRTENRIEGAVQWIDRFGNLIANISGSMLNAFCAVERGDIQGRFAEKLRVVCGGMEINALVASYGQCTPGEIVAIVGSSGFLEVAVVNGSAAQQLQVAVGAAVIVESQSNSAASLSKIT